MDKEIRDAFSAVKPVAEALGISDEEILALLKAIKDITNTEKEKEDE